MCIVILYRFSAHCYIPLLKKIYKKMDGTQVYSVFDKVNKRKCIDFINCTDKIIACSK